MSSPSQKRSVRDFKSVTGSTDQLAADILRQNNWQLEQALDYFFTHRHRFTASTSKQPSADKAKIEAIFTSYTDANATVLSDDALLQYFGDINVDASSVTTLHLAYLFKCKTFGTFSRTEFTNGWYTQNIDTVEKMKQFVSSSDVLKQLVTDKKMFKEFYRWLFDYIKEEPDRKTIDADTAYDMWQLVLKPHFAHIDLWLQFCSQQQKLRAVPKDVWEQLLEFTREIRPDFSNYDIDGGAWPLIMDEFVEYVRKQPGSTSTT